MILSEKNDNFCKQNRFVWDRDREASPLGYGFSSRFEMFVGKSNRLDFTRMNKSLIIFDNGLFVLVGVLHLEFRMMANVFCGHQTLKSTVQFY